MSHVWSAWGMTSKREGRGTAPPVEVQGQCLRPFRTVRYAPAPIDRRTRVPSTYHPVGAWSVAAAGSCGGVGSVGWGGGACSSFGGGGGICGVSCGGS